MILWPCYIILICLVAAFWLWLLISPTQRRVSRFTYSAADAPHQLNNLIPHDDILQQWGGDGGGDPPTWPSVAVIIPGRNEGHLLDTTLRSLCAMDYPNFRIIFVDDQSTDSTPAVCRRLEQEFPHLFVLHNTTPPEPSWVGKSWAIHQGLAHAPQDTDYLLFCDSDLVFHPQCLRQMMRLALHRRTDIASLLPTLEYQSLGELLGLAAAMTFITLIYPLGITNDPRSPKSLIAGGFFLIKTAVYHEIGGHAAVRGQMIEDIAIGTLAKSRGKRVFTVLTRDLLRARMYEGWHDTFHGLKKNAFGGVHYRYPSGLGAVLFMLLVGALVPVYVVIGGVLISQHFTPAIVAALLISLLAWLAMTLTGSRNARLAGLPVYAALLMPASFTFLMLVLLGAMLDFFRGGNTWSGRRMASQHTHSLDKIK